MARFVGKILIDVVLAGAVVVNSLTSIAALIVSLL